MENPGTAADPAADPAAEAAAARRAAWLLGLLTVVAFLLRVPGLDAEEPWFDEVFSIVLAAQDLPELARRAVADQTNPPGFYLLLWGWTRLFGDGLVAMRMLPALCGTLTVPALASAAGALGLSRRAGLVAAALAAVSPLAWAMSSELRAYAPMLLVTVLVILACAKRRYFVAALAAVVLAMLHYFGALALVAIAAGFAWTARRAAWRVVAAFVPSALVMAAWLRTVMAAAGAGGVGGNASWVAVPSLGQVFEFASAVLGAFGSGFGLTVAAAILATAAAHAVRMLSRPAARGDASHPDTASAARVALAVAVLPLLLVITIGLATGRGLWVPRYLVIVLPGWYLLVALMLDRVSVALPHDVASDANAVRGWFRRALLPATLAWAAIGGLHSEWTRPRKTPWTTVARELSTHGWDSICTNESYVALPFRYAALTAGVPLTVLDLDQCTAERQPDAIVIRQGTERSLGMLRERGATVLPGESLRTRLPVTIRYDLSWPAPP